MSLSIRKKTSRFSTASLRKTQIGVRSLVIQKIHKKTIAPFWKEGRIIPTGFKVNVLAKKINAIIERTKKKENMDQLLALRPTNIKQKYLSISLPNTNKCHH